MTPPSSDVLFGRQTNRTRRILGVTAVLFLCVFLLATHARGRWMQPVMETTWLPVAFVVLVGGGLAIWNAYWNDGLLLNWLLILSLVTPWLVHYNLRLGIAEPFVSAGYLTLALVVGTVGYVVGVGIRRASPDGAADGAADGSDVGDGSARDLSAVFGSTPDRPVRWSLLLGGLFAVPAGLVAVAGPYRSLLVSIAYPVAWFYPVGTVTGETVVGVVLVLGWIAVATWPASRGDGLLVSWGVLFAPTFGTLVSYSLLESFFTSDLSASVVNDVLIAAVVAAALSVVLGALGFVIGVGVRRTDLWERGHERTGV